MADDRVQRLASSEQVRRFLASPNTGVYIVRQDGHIVWASPSMLAVTGRRPEDLVGRNGWEVFVLPEDLAEVARFKAYLADQDGVIWMRLQMPEGWPLTWFRVDTWVSDDHVLCAFRPERNADLHHLHSEHRPRADVA